MYRILSCLSRSAEGGPGRGLSELRSISDGRRAPATIAGRRGMTVVSPLRNEDVNNLCSLSPGYQVLGQ